MFSVMVAGRLVSDHRWNRSDRSIREGNSIEMKDLL